MSATTMNQSVLFPLETSLGTMNYSSSHSDRLMSSAVQLAELEQKDPPVWIYINDVTIKDLYAHIRCGHINPDPPAQRCATEEPGGSKSQGIIRCVVENMTLGSVTLRVRSNKAALLEGLDGGHRLRFIEKFMNNEFYLNRGTQKVWYNMDTMSRSWAKIVNIHGANARNLTDEERMRFDSFVIPIQMVRCTSRRAREIFRNLNRSTPVKSWAMLMCDEESKICEWVRSKRSYYVEYQNAQQILPIFQLNDEDRPKYWSDKVPNAGGHWDGIIFIALLKVLGGGHVSAGESDATLIVDEEEQTRIMPITPAINQTVCRFFEDLLMFIKAANLDKRKFTHEWFAVFQLVWFALYEQNKKFVIADMSKFADSLKRARIFLLDKTVKDAYDKPYSFVIPMTKKTKVYVSSREFVRENLKAYSKNHEQRQCAEFFLKVMKDPKTFGVIFKDKNRSASRSDREAIWLEQEKRCYIDITVPGQCPLHGQQLEFQHAQLAHDTPYSMGGTTDGAVIMCGKCNRKQGQLPLQSYVTALKEGIAQNK